MRRRRFIAALATTALFGRLGSASASEARLRALETTSGGRLGVHLLDTADGRRYGYRSDERFMMLSSFKLLASALVLRRVDRGQEALDRRIAYTRKDLVPGSPVSGQHADGGGMTLGELCQATITTSDNTAANLILSSFGGPGALTDYARELGDSVSRFDRGEPQVNVRGADPLMDTTSPRAMLGNVQSVVLGDALSAASRAQLQHWLLGNTTGATRLKAGLPGDWRIGDKTGSNASDANDIGVVWPVGRPPLLVAAYLADSQASQEIRNATLAAVGQWVRDIALGMP